MVDPKDIKVGSVFWMVVGGLENKTTCKTCGTVLSTLVYRPEKRSIIEIVTRERYKMKTEVKYVTNTGPYPPDALYATAAEARRVARVLNKKENVEFSKVYGGK